MSMLFLKCERDAYAARFVRNGRQRAEMEWQVVTDAFDYLRTPRQTRDPDMVREMWFFVDARQAKMTDEEYDRLYPDGLVVPEDRVPGNLEGGT